MCCPQANGTLIDHLCVTGMGSSADEQIHSLSLNIYICIADYSYFSKVLYNYMYME